jgi:hypothetical protein
MMRTQAQPPPPIAPRKSNNGGGSYSFESSFVYPSGVILNVAVLQAERRALVLMVPETGFWEAPIGPGRIVGNSYLGITSGLPVTREQSLELPLSL